ncbi:MAG: MFS transporter [Spirochaetales bacterium]|jgi:MFS family permease|nr:MFS transporter [Spirochaetales bacterium]
MSNQAVQGIPNQESPKFQRYFVLLFIALAGGVITKLPYLFWTYYVPLMNATGITNTQIGLLSTAYGLVNFICYLPGGILADRFSAKKLVVIACLGTALVGFWYSFLPGVIWLMVIHMAFAITTVFVFWAAMIKAVNNLGSAKEQGRIFGSFEGARYLIGIIVSYGSIAVFSRFAEEVGGLRGVILYYSILLVAAALLIGLFLKESKAVPAGKGEEAKPKLTLKDFLAVLKYPPIWMCGILVFCAYANGCFGNYVSPYFVRGFEVSSTMSAFLFTTAASISAVIAAFLGGFLADRIGSRVRYISIIFVLMALFSAALLVIPVRPALLWVFYVPTILEFYCYYSIKALFFSTIDDVNIPKHLTGAASGVISLVGYAPEIFIYVLIGQIIDTHTDSFLGYQIAFACMVGTAVIGAVCGFVLMKMIKSGKAPKTSGAA